MYSSIQGRRRSTRSTQPTTSQHKLTWRMGCAQLTPCWAGTHTTNSPKNFILPWGRRGISNTTQDQPPIGFSANYFFFLVLFFPCLQHMTDKLNITQVHGQEERAKKETRKELQKVPTSALVDTFQPLQVVAVVVFVAAAALSLTHHRILQRGKLARHSRVFLSLSGSTNSLLTSAPGAAGGLLLLLSSTSGEEHLQNKHSFFLDSPGCRKVI